MTLPERFTRDKDGVVEENLDYLVRFALFRVGEKSLAEDIVHDAVVRFLDRCPRGLEAARMRAYLFRIVYNLCMTAQAADRRRSLREVSLDSAERAVADDDDSLDEEEARRLNRMLDGLPEKEKEVVRMRAMDGLSFVEISEILSLPQSTLKSRYKSGLDRLRILYCNNKPL